MESPKVVNASCDSVHISSKFIEYKNRFGKILIDGNTYKKNFIDEIIGPNFTVSHSGRVAFLLEWKCVNIAEWYVSTDRNCFAECGGKGGLCSACGHKGGHN